jgi:hypothetical protein
MGDAAHAVSPSLGQGCNAALEDVVIFDQLLDEYKGMDIYIHSFTSYRGSLSLKFLTKSAALFQQNFHDVRGVSPRHVYFHTFILRRACATHSCKVIYFTVIDINERLILNKNITI